MDALTLFGLAAVSLMLVFYALEDQGAGYILAFAVSCLLGSLYGFLQGAWPFGVIEAIWSAVAARRWYLRQSLGQSLSQSLGQSLLQTANAPRPMRSKVLPLP